MYFLEVAGIINILLFLNLVTSLPTKETYYDKLIAKCPKIKKDSEFASQSIFQECSDINEIFTVKSLKPSTLNNVLCLIYFNSVAFYCNQTKNDIIKENAIPDLSAVKSDILCSEFPQIHNLSNGIVTNELCPKICGDFDFSKMVCQLSQYIVTGNNILDIKEPAPSKLKPNFVDRSELEIVHKVVTSARPELALKKVAEENPQIKPVQSLSDILNNKLRPQIVIETPKLNPTIKVNPEPMKVNHDPITEQQVQQPVDSKKYTVSNGITIELKDDKKKADLDDTNTLHNIDDDTIKANVDPAVPIVEKETADIKTKLTVSNTSTSSTKVAKDSTFNLETPDVKEPPVKALEGNLNINDEEDKPEEPNKDFSKEDGGRDENLDDDTEPFQQESVVDNGALEKVPPKSNIIDQEPSYSSDDMDGDSYFFSYFMVICVVIVLGYVTYHNRQKLFALLLEGKRNKRQYRGRRPNSANYHKLDSNLEEAITSECSKNTSHIIY